MLLSTHFSTAYRLLVITDVAGARHYRELIAWQIGDQLRIETFKLTRRPPFARDFRHQSQTEDAIDSVCRNIAEGFGCESHDEFARFLVISRRSLNEVFDTLRSAELKRYVTREELVPLQALGRRLYPALSNLIAYLRRTGKRAQDRTDKNRNRTNNDRDRTNNDPDRTDKRPDRTDKRPARTDNDPDRTDNDPDRTDNDRDRTSQKKDRPDTP